MIKVFIGGSRKLGRLNDHIRQRLDNIVQKKYTILVGDANGIDKAVQNYMSNKSYNNVLVYHVGNRYRNNIGRWETRQVEEPGKVKDFTYYATKDLQMIKDTDYGLMIWDLESKGTLNNIINLLRLNKTVVVYVSKLKEFYNLSSIEDLEKFLNRFEDNSLKQLAKTLGLDKECSRKQEELKFT